MSRLISTGKSMDVLVKMAAAQLGHDQSDDDDNEDDLTLSLQSDATVDMNNEEENKVTPLFRDSSTETFLKKLFHKDPAYWRPESDQTKSTAVVNNGAVTPSSEVQLEPITFGHLPAFETEPDFWWSNTVYSNPSSGVVKSSDALQEAVLIANLQPSNLQESNRNKRRRVDSTSSILDQGQSDKIGQMIYDWFIRESTSEREKTEILKLCLALHEIKIVSSNCLLRRPFLTSLSEFLGTVKDLESRRNSLQLLERLINDVTDRDIKSSLPSIFLYQLALSTRDADEDILRRIQDLKNWLVQVQVPFDS